jgi:hypothetical protein
MPEAAKRLQLRARGGRQHRRRIVGTAVSI